MVNSVHVHLEAEDAVECVGVDALRLGVLPVLNLGRDAHIYFASEEQLFRARAALGEYLDGRPHKAAAQEPEAA